VKRYSDPKMGRQRFFEKAKKHVPKGRVPVG